MQTLALVLAAVLTVALPCQDPSPDPGAGPDRIVLDVGTVLTGRILQETDEYIEIEIAPGTVVGFDRRRAVEIARVAAPIGVRDRPVASAEPEQAWYALVDGDGQSAGWLHWSRGPEADGRIRLTEEWRFVADGRTTEVSVVEVVEPAGNAVSCFAHERVRSDDGSFVGRETIVRARIEGDDLVVDRRQGDGSSRQRYPAPRGLRFPLSLADELRRQPAGHHQHVTRLVFDPIAGEFEQRNFEVGRTRRVADESGTRRVRIVTAETDSGSRAEWVDAAAQVLRREIRGTSLVALAATEAQARRWSKRRERIQPPSLVTSGDGRIALWLPNPAWSPLEAATATTEISARNEFDDAVFTLMRLEQFPAGTPLPTVTDAVLRWLRLVHPGLEGLERRAAIVRGRPAERIRARFAEGTVVYGIDVHVFARGDAWFATSAAAPRQRVTELRADFERLLDRVELHPQGFAPRQQGPLAEPMKTDQRR